MIIATILIVFLVLIFFVIGLFHIVGVFLKNKKFIEEYFMPSDVKGNLKIKPKIFDYIFVRLIFWFFTFFYFNQLDIFDKVYLPNWINDYLGFFLSAIFILRAVGEFKYLGFFKRVRNTKFSKMDSLYFSPLCFLLGVICLWIEVN